MSDLNITFGIGSNRKGAHRSVFFEKTTDNGNDGQQIEFRKVEETDNGQKDMKQILKKLNDFETKMNEQSKKSQSGNVSDFMPILEYGLNAMNK